MEVQRKTRRGTKKYKELDVWVEMKLGTVSVIYCCMTNYAKLCAVDQ
jgi:hypothetical protein